MADSPPKPFGHEPASVDIRHIHIAGAILLVTVLTLGLGLYWALVRRVDSDQVQVAARPDRIPPAPRLQVDARADLATLQRQQQALLSGYAWVDASHTSARIPIQRAMQIYAREHSK